MELILLYPGVSSMGDGAGASGFACFCPECGGHDILQLLDSYLPCLMESVRAHKGLVKD